MRRLALGIFAARLQLPRRLGRASTMPATRSLALAGSREELGPRAQRRREWVEALLHQSVDERVRLLRAANAVGWSSM